MFNVLLAYINRNKIVAFVCFYFLFSAILKATADVDICIPCLWKLLFGFRCPGCGLTTAFIGLIELDLNKAIESNWLIFIILPSGILYTIKDFVRFRKEYNT